MNTEVKITLIACAIIFTGIGVLALNTINSENVSNVPAVPQKAPEQWHPSESPAPLDSKMEKNSSVIEYPRTVQKKIDDNTSLRLTTLILSIPENNTHPWGTVKGKVDMPAPGNPVIIQFFKSLDEKPVHVAQVNVNEDDSFEYKFRLLSINNGKTTHFFEDDYFVKIFKTILTP